jgi:hypothetical protein
MEPPSTTRSRVEGDDFLRMYPKVIVFYKIVIMCNSWYYFII